ncbi:MAG: permease [Clostridiales bacterium]|nr:permease [Clostridiales bacterium]
MIKDISVLFISIILEALPFLLLGSLISAIIQEYISDDFFKKVIPKNPILGSIVGVILGFFIPACDCAVIPIALRLKKKNVPLNVCISFMLSSPIINPVAILSVVYAFKSTMPEIAIWRLVGGVIVSIVVGVIMSIMYKRDEDIFYGNAVIDDGCVHCGHNHRHEMHNSECHCDDGHGEHSHNGNHECHCHGEDEGKHKKKFTRRMLNVIDHTKGDFLDVIKYMIFGSLITATLQILMAKFNITLGANNSILQMIVMMAFAYIVSLCSTADSFIAKTFIYEMSKSSILAYLIFGPMIDIKNTLYLAEKCKKSFVTKFIIVLSLVTFVVSLIIGYKVLGG